MSADEIRASNYAYRSFHGFRPDPLGEALEQGIKAAEEQAKAFKPVFGAPAAPITPPPPPLPPAPPPPVQITFKGSWGIYGAPKPQRAFNDDGLINPRRT
jgi:hypothetical protein